MENEIISKKSIWDSKIFRVVLVLLIIVLLAGLGYLVYEKYIKAADINDNKVVETTLSKTEVAHLANIKDYEVYLDRLVNRSSHTFNEQKIIDFTKEENNQIKTEIALDLLETVFQPYGVYCTYENNDEFCILTNITFNDKIKDVFGRNTLIDIDSLNQPIETGICAEWNYNDKKQQFERGSDICAIGSGDFIINEYVGVNYKIQKVTNGYEATSKIVYVLFDDSISYDEELNVCDLYNNKDSEKVTKMEDCSRENVENYVNANQSKFYTRKYTYRVDGENVYISKYELIKQ